MNKRIRYLEVYNNDYKDNKLPEIIKINIGDSFKDCLDSMGTILKMNPDEVNVKWKKWNKRHHIHMINYDYIDFKLFKIWYKNFIKHKEIVIEPKKKYISQIFICYELDNKLEKMNIQDLLYIYSMNDRGLSVSNITAYYLNDMYDKNSYCFDILHGKDGQLYFNIIFINQ